MRGRLNSNASSHQDWDALAPSSPLPKELRGKVQHDDDYEMVPNKFPSVLNVKKTRSASFAMNL